MATWQPSQTVENSEVVGRQIRRNVSSDASISIAEVEIGDFFDSRTEKDLSFDRLGPGAAIKKVKKDITDIVDDDLLKEGRPERFVGWCALHSNKWKFKYLNREFYPDPTFNDDGSARNYVHTQLSRDGYREKGKAYSLAISLFHQINKNNGWIENPIR